MPWADSSPVQNVPSTPHLGRSRHNPETPVALVPETIWFDSPGFDYTVPGTPVTTTQIPSSTAPCRPSCDRHNLTSDFCCKCFMTKTPTLSYKRRNISKDLFSTSPTISKDTPSKKEQVVPGTPHNPGKRYNPGTPYSQEMPYNQGTPYNPNSYLHDYKRYSVETPTPERQYLARKRHRLTTSPEAKASRNKASINLFRGDDIFG